MVSIDLKLNNFNLNISHSLAIAQEGKWIWFSSGQAPTYSSWGPNFPNTDAGNTDDCALMVLQSDGFWWEDCNCLTSEIDKKTIAPICQYENTDEITTVSTSTTTTAATPGTTTMFSCPDDWVKYDGHCYYGALEEFTWTEAENECILLGGHLASIHSQAEQDFVILLLAEYLQIDFPVIPTGFWIGASKTEPQVKINQCGTVPRKLLYELHSRE